MQGLAIYFESILIFCPCLKVTLLFCINRSLTLRSFGQIALVVGRFGRFPCFRRQAFLFSDCYQFGCIRLRFYRLRAGSFLLCLGKRLAPLMRFEPRQFGGLLPFLFWRQVGDPDDYRVWFDKISNPLRTRRIGFPQ